jgi:hypothetical protein
MRRRAEEDPDDPDYDDEEVQVQAAPVPAVSLGGREYEFKTEVLAMGQVTDGKTLPERLTAASAEGWDLVEIVDAGESRVLLLRRAKRTSREPRSVGFAPYRP